MPKHFASAPELLATQYGPEIWDLFAGGLLAPDTPLTVRYERKAGTVDLGAYEFGSAGPPLITASLFPSPKRLLLAWPSATGARYQLQSATNLSAPGWTAEGPPLTGTGGVLQTNLPVTAEPRKFYRLLLNP